MARTNKEKALLYAAFVMLKREVEKDGDLEPGTYVDVTGCTLSITFPKGTVVERETGTHGNGLMMKKAVQNLYGYPLWALMVHRLRKFHQWNVLRGIILECVTDVLKRRGKANVRDEIRAEYPETVALMDELQEQLPIPARNEETPRLCKDPGLPPTITVRIK